VTLSQLIRSALHTRPSQLAQRVRRIVRQRLHDAAPARTARAVEGELPRFSSAPPLPLFGPRDERVAVLRGGLHASFLNVNRSLEAPVDWSPVLTPELERMNLHYMEFLEALDDAPFERVVLDWIAHNPLGSVGSWRIGWNSFVVSLRVVVWMQQLAARRQRLSPELVEAMHRSLGEQVRFLESHLELDIGGNHLIKNAKALLWAGAYFEGDEAARWTARGERLLLPELEEQVLSDGMHYERSPAYHAQVFADLLECALVAGPAARDAIVATLERMAQPLVDLTHPDGAPSLFNDGGLSMSYSTAECVAVYERVTSLRAPAPRALFEYPAAGYYGRRSAGELCVVDCGAIAPDHLPAHGHGDVLAFEWSVGGQRFIVDAGVYEYERGEWRDRARSTLSHNTVSLDGRDQCEFWAAFRVGRRARVRRSQFETLGKCFTLTGSHDGYRGLAGAPTHERRFVVGEGSVVVDDTVHDGAGQRVQARLLLHPEVRVHATKRAFLLQRGDVYVALHTGSHCALVDAHWFPDFGVKRATKQIVLTYSDAPSFGRFALTRAAAPTRREVAAALPARLREEEARR